MILTNANLHSASNTGTDKWNYCLYWMCITLLCYKIGKDEKKKYSNYLAFSMHFLLLWWFFSPLVEQKRLNMLGKPINLASCWVTVTSQVKKLISCSVKSSYSVVRWTQETAPNTDILLNNGSTHWWIQNNLSSYFSVLLCCGVHWASDPSLLTDAATVDIVSASSLLLWSSAIKASSCFLLCRSSSLKISCLLISDHNCLR